MWSRLPATEENRRWLSGVLAAAIAEYRNVWSSPPRRIPVCEGDACLARYFGESAGEPPEVEPGHFDGFYQQHAVAHGHCERPKDANDVRRFLDCVAGIAERYRKGKLLDPVIDEFFKNDACMRESGHDTTYRFKVVGEERCIDFATVDLNSLLFKVETDIATLVQEVFGGKFGNETTKNFCRRAESRALLMRRHLWDEGSGLFFDYDVQRGRHSGYVSATTLYPLWASAPNVCGASLVTPGNGRGSPKERIARARGPRRPLRDGAELARARVRSGGVFAQTRWHAANDATGTAVGGAERMGASSNARVGGASPARIRRRRRAPHLPLARHHRTERDGRTTAPCPRNST